MVGTLLKLKMRLTWNQLSRSTAMLVGTIFGLLYLSGFLVVTVAGILAAAQSGYMPLASLVIVLAGTGLGLVSFVLPIFMPTQDTTITPRLFINTNSPGLKFGIPYLITELCFPTSIVLAAILLLVPSAGWLIHGSPLAALVSAIGGFMGAMIITLILSVSTLIAVRVEELSPRVKRVGSVLLFSVFLLIMITAGRWLDAIIDVLQGAATKNFTVGFIATILGWTPLGAPFMSSYYAYTGNWGLVAATLGITLVTLVALVWVWLSMLPTSMLGKKDKAVNWQELYQTQTTKPAKAAVTNKADQSLKQALPLVTVLRKIGFSNPTAGVAGRSLIYWFKDSRYSISLLIPIVFVLAAAFLNLGDGNINLAMTYYILIFALSGLGLPSITDLSMDSTAFWHHVTSGMPGKADRLGRLLGAWIWQIPYTVLIIAMAKLLIGIDLLILSLISFPVLFTLQALGTFVSAKFVYPSKAPGSSPLSNNGAGSQMLQSLVTFGTMFATGILTFPGWGIYLILIHVAPDWAWISVLLGYASTLGYLLIAIRVGGKVLESNWANIIASMRTWPGHSL